VNIQSISEVRSLNKKEKIFVATIEIVKEDGLEGATISKISKLAKVSPGIIYHYFNTKDEIIHSIAVEIREEFLSIYDEDSPLVLPIFDCYKQIWIRMYHYGIKEPEKMLFMEQYRNSSYEKAAETIQNTGFLKKLHEKNRDAISKGHMKNLPMLAIYAMTIGTAIEFVKLTINGLKPFEKCSMEEVADSICSGLLK